MNYKIHISILLGAITILSSCSNYGYISENDVYMQAPTEINLEEDESDLTSYNAFKAREKGAFQDEYIDPRVNERVRMNQFMIFDAYHPYGYSYSMFGNQPIRFHGMGMYNSFYSGYGFMGPTFGYGFSSGLGMEMYYLRFNTSYYGGNYGGYYNPYGYGYYPYHYAGGYYNGGVVNQNHSTTSQPIHYGSRRTLTSSSSRSSSYENTISKQPVVNSTSAYDVNDQTLGNSRRDVKRRYAGSSDYSNNGNPNTTNSYMNKNGNAQSTGSAHQRAASQNYTPNSSARRSGSVRTQRSINASGSSRSRSVSSSPSHRSSSSPMQARPQSRGTVSGGTSRRTSSPSTTRSSGTTNSNSGRR